ncbi:MAG: tRNA (adenosine(37)-N6)-dimethylallyltransferase MiaA, partial [Porticoccaceae bacterium]|nr:tRNA (adenosine(37)-N6)-dimethylallyltransferase MiaA [Porticoccaceae bacterium]
IEIVSVDSAQVYRQLDIGSAKPSTDMLRAVPHWLIDVVDPSEIYSVAKFVDDARAAIVDIVGRGKIPLLVGGSMMYFRVLLSGLTELPEANADIRSRLKARIDEHGIESLYKQLKDVDAATAEDLHPHQSQRIQRALEVFEITGKPLSALHRLSSISGLTADYRVYQFGLLVTDRALLHRRIEQRFRAMMTAGFYAEVEALYLRGDLHGDLPAMRSVGYRQLWDCVDNCGSQSEAVERGIVATRQLAKRQMTWMRRWIDLNLLAIDADNYRLGAKKITEKCLKNILMTPISHYVDR